MKIAYFVHSLSVGGAETLACNYLLKLKEFGHEVILIQKRDDKSFLNKKITDAGIPTYTLTPSGRDVMSKGRRFLVMKFFIGAKLNKLLKKLKVDVLHNHISFEGIKKLPLKAQNIFYSIHTDVERTFKIYGKSHYKNTKNFISKGINVIVLTEKMRDDLLHYFPNAKNHLFGNGIEVEKILNSKYNREEFLSSYGIEKDSFVLGHAGRYFPVKNHQKVIEVFAELKKLHANSNLILVGTGNDEGKTTVNNLIKKYDVEKDVVQLGLREDVPAIMSVLDAFILPSFNEGYGLVVLEAQIHGVRSVISKAVSPEVVYKNNVTIMDINTSSTEWAKALLEQPSDVALKDVNEYSIDNVMRKHEKIYLESL